MKPNNFFTEISALKPLLKTRRGGNSVYLFIAREAPSLFEEVARLREVTYRDRGGGTGREIDEDDFDHRENPYRQVVIWNEKYREIVGAFRYGLGRDGDFSTQSLYDFSKTFMRDIHPKAMDIGRMFIQPAYQLKGKRVEGVFSLDNLWDGLGAVISIETKIEYLLGRVVSFKDDEFTGQMIADFFAISFHSDSPSLMFAKKPHFADIIYGNLFKKHSIKQNYKTLLKQIRKNEHIITPLILAYLQVAKTLQYMGSTIDEELNVLQSCIMIKREDICSQFKKRYFIFSENSLN